MSTPVPPHPSAEVALLCNKPNSNDDPLAVVDLLTEKQAAASSTSIITTTTTDTITITEGGEDEGEELLNYGKEEPETISAKISHLAHGVIEEVKHLGSVVSGEVAHIIELVSPRKNPPPHAHTNECLQCGKAASVPDHLHSDSCCSVTAADVSSQNIPPVAASPDIKSKPLTPVWSKKAKSE